MNLSVKPTTQCVSFADEIPLKSKKDERSTRAFTNTISNSCGFSEIVSNVPADHSAVMLQYPDTEVVYHFRSYKRPSKLDQLQENWRKMGSDALATVLSALYGKLLVVMGMAFPMSEVISTHIPHSYYEVYYLYLYIGSMMFLFYMYVMLCKMNSKSKDRSTDTESSSSSCSEMGNSSPTTSSHSSGSESDYNKEVRKMSDICLRSSINERKVNKLKSKYFEQNRRVHQHFGSFYLRMGAVAFGIGSMIYSGLEIGQYFELERNTKCHNFLVAVTPATRMAFIFIQMYFIFLNEEEQTKVTRHRIFSRFGLMHMIGTNLSVWLNVLIQETKHEILTFYNPEHNTIEMSKQNGRLHSSTRTSTVAPSTARAPISNASHIGATSSVLAHLNSTLNTTKAITSTFAPAAPLAPMTTSFFESVLNYTEGIKHKRSIGGTHYIYDCRRTNIIGSLVQNASPFLFPCTIEYSLICAAILYVMWRNISNVDSSNNVTESTSKLPQIPQFKKAPHHYSVDCAQAHKGLFLGIFFLVLTIISLILFFVLVSKPELIAFAVMEVNICELSLYGLSTAGSLIGMIQVRQLKFNGSRNLELDNILLVGAQTGILMYSTFTIIGCHFTQEKDTLLVSITAFASLIQTTCQTLFILDASRRSCITQEQIRCKPGRETITFLLVNNLAMWAINTLEKSRADSHPIQLHFYGLWAWTIITHVSMPLAIFYRFHSTVCLCEIWKRAYKIKHNYM